LGHRQADFRDVLSLKYDAGSEDLFIGLRTDYELNETEVDGEKAYLKYTTHIWDGTTLAGLHAVQKNLANCYESADVWAHQYFNIALGPISPLDAAEVAVRSQCFSNSRANQRWASEDAGFWSLNTDHGVHANVIINAGWLSPDKNYQIFIQKFDEAVFKGPRTIEKTDAVGQLMSALPTLVEGDRVLLKAKNSNYDLVIPCVPYFTGFSGAPGIPYVPGTVSPHPVPTPPIIIPVPVPVPPTGDWPEEENE
jgi:hypothetical protein